MFVRNGGWFGFKAKSDWLVTDTLIRSEMFRPGWVGGGGGGEGELLRSEAGREGAVTGPNPSGDLARAPR